MSNLATLVPFKKGNDPRRNTKGKEKGTVNLKTLLITFLNERSPEAKDTYKNLLIKRMGKMAIVDGNEQIIKLIWDYIEGKPTIEPVLSVPSQTLIIIQTPHGDTSIGVQTKS